MSRYNHSAPSFSPAGSAPNGDAHLNDSAILSHVTAQSEAAFQAASALQPGSTLGVLGGGQLGRMFAIAAIQLGYKVHVFAEQDDSPASQVATHVTVGRFDDMDAVTTFAKSVDAVTLEFENIPASTLKHVGEFTRTSPNHQVLEVLQDRRKEKTFCRDAGVEVTPFYVVETKEDLLHAYDQLGAPGVLKSAQGGYDGHGQIKLTEGLDADALIAAWGKLGGKPAVYEKFIALQKEVSVVAARVGDDFYAYPLFENEHERHILDGTSFPADVPTAIAEKAISAAKRVGDALGIVGVYCVEFFISTDGDLYLNEVAPRPHNTGHLTIDLPGVSQFDLQVMTMCHLPLPPMTMTLDDYPYRAAMVNLLGDIWLPNSANGLDTSSKEDQNVDLVFSDADVDVSPIFHDPYARLHLYGKWNVRKGRKMGHITEVRTLETEKTEKKVTGQSILRKLRLLRTEISRNTSASHS